MKKMRIVLALLLFAFVNSKANIVSVNFTYDPVCDGASTTLVDASVVNNGATIIEWAWDVNGDGDFVDPEDIVGTNSTVSVPLPYNTTPQPGEHNIGLRITTNQGQVSTHWEVVYVNPNPVASFSAPDVCEGTASTLTDQSTLEGNGSIVNWEWDFLNTPGVYDDSTGSAISVDFGNDSTFVVGLLVTSDQGCQSTTSENVTVDPMPTVSFTDSLVCLGDETVLTANSTIASGLVTDYDWELTEDFVNNPFADTSGQVITNQFASDGNYQIGLQVTSDQGCLNQDIHVVTIAPFPFVGFSANNACQDQVVAFTNETYQIVGSIDYEWSFSQEGTSAAEDTVFEFSSAGGAEVMLIGTTSYGCADTATKTIVIYPTPLAGFDYTEVCFGNTSSFTNTSDPKGGTISEYQWYFGDGNEGTGTNPNHQYYDIDEFVVTLVAESTDGCRDTIQHNVNVWPLPIPEITSDGPLQFCEGEDVVLTVNPSGDQILWSTGDYQMQSITVDTTGTYTVKITDGNQCQGETLVEVYSWRLPELTVINDTSISLGQSAELWVEGANDSYQWSPDTYLDNPTSANPTSVTPDETITYTVTGADLHLFEGNQYYCYSSAEVTVEVIVDYNLQPVNLFTPNGDGSNPRFYIENLQSYDDCVVKVYNRWGTEVYTSDKDEDEDDDGFWTGTRSGDQLPDGTYYYTIECDGREDRFDGAVTIFRGEKRRY